MNPIEKKEDRRALSGRPPYGYRLNREENLFEIDKKEAAIYQWIIKMYVEQNMSLRDITIMLKRKGIKCKRSEWSKSTLNCVLKNPFYCGHEQLIPPLISKSTWDKIQTKMNKKKINPSYNCHNSVFFLRDVLKCARCGGSVRPRLGSFRKDGTAPRYYVCYWAGTSRKNIEAESGRKKCSMPFLKADMVETAVWNEVKLTCFPEVDETKFNVLSPDDRKVLVEDVLEGDIYVDYRDDFARNGPEALRLDCQLQPSRAIHQKV
ncbi:MAG: recombinase family protein [Desulfovibrionales bacterium]